MTITIATWNIAGARPIKSAGLFDYGAEDVSYFSEQLHELDADIVCLQETHLNNERSVAKVLAENLGYALHEVETSPSHIDKAYSLGNAVFYRSEQEVTVKDFVFPYPSFPLSRQDGVPTVHIDKGFQLAQFDFAAVVNLQMQPLKFLGTPYDSENGMQFAKEMEAVLLREIDRPTILCGDFNFAKPELLYLRALSGKVNALPNVPTRPEGKRTDFIFIPSETEIADSGVIATNSDHFLCWARLEIA